MFAGQLRWIWYSGWYRLVDGSKSVITEQIILLRDYIRRTNTARCPLKLMWSWFGAIMSNFYSQKPSISKSQFCGSPVSGHISIVTALLPLFNHVGHSRFWILQLTGYATFQWYPKITPFSNSESSKLRGSLHAIAFVVAYHTLCNGGGHNVYQHRRYLRYMIRRY